MAFNNFEGLVARPSFAASPDKKSALVNALSGMATGCSKTSIHEGF